MIPYIRFVRISDDVQSPARLVNMRFDGLVFLIVWIVGIFFFIVYLDVWF
jgi:hypothetical protein